MNTLNWRKDYTGHYSAVGVDNVYVITSNRGAGWTLIILDRITDMQISSHTDSHKSAVTTVAAAYETSDSDGRSALRTQFRA